MIVIGFDPGPKWTGFAMIECHAASAKFVSGGKIESSDESFHTHINKVDRDALCAIEKCGLAYRVQAANALIQTSEIVGLIRGVAGVYLYSECVRMTSFEVRKALCGKRNASDAEVKAALMRRIGNLPRTNSHVRDAVAVALIAWQRHKK